MMKKHFFVQADLSKYNQTLVTFLSDQSRAADSMDEAEAIKAQELAEKNMHDKESDP